MIYSIKKQATAQVRVVLWAGTAVLSLLTVMPLTAQATDFPERPIKIVVGFTAGGTTDVLARLLAKNMADTLGKSIIVENRAGASGTIAADYVARSKPDGYTIMFTTSSVQGIAPALFKKLPYDSYTAFAPIGLVSRSVMVMLANNNFPANTVQEMVALAKKKPDSVTFASAGPGSTAHVVAELFARQADIKMLHVPYKGGSAGTLGVMGGEVDVTFDNIASTRQLIDNGQVKPIAVTSSDRSASLPNVPTFVESGYPAYSITSWGGLVAPAGTPPDIIKKLNDAANKAVQSDEVKTAMIKGDTEPQTSSPEQFDAFLKKEQAKWADAIHVTGITLQ